MLYLWSKRRSALSALCLAMLAPVGLSHAEDFNNASNAFYSETHVFNSESDRLVKNTQQVDETLVNLERVLQVPHRAAQGLKTLDVTLAAVKDGLAAAEAVPQTREKAKKLKASLEAIQKPVHGAAGTADKIDKATTPAREATQKAEQTCQRVLTAEGELKHVSNGYFDQVDHLVLCTHSHPNIEPASVKVVGGTTAVYIEVDKEMKLINDKYEQAVQAPAKALHALQDQIAPLEKLIPPVESLNGRLDPLRDPLVELKKILDQRVGVSFGFPVPGICHKNGVSAPYPCGVKTCKKWPGVKYPCGTKWCTKSVDIPYPCPKDQHVDITMSVSDALQGVDAIEKKIESMLSSTAWTALKTVGVDKIVHELQSKANSLVNAVLSKLHLDVDTSLPGLDIAFNANVFNAALADINKLGGVLNQFEPMLDVDSPAFKPFALSGKFAKEAFSLAHGVGCATKPLPVPQPTIHPAPQIMPKPFIRPLILPRLLGLPRHGELPLK